MHLPNYLLRRAGHDAPAAAVALLAAARGSLPVVISQLSDPDLADDTQADYAQIDHTLVLVQPPALTELPAPADGLGYSGFTPQQRAAFLRWAAKPTDEAPPAFQQLYLANLEIRLLEAEPLPNAARTALLGLSAAPAWRAQRGLSRTLLLAFWLAQDGNGLATWLAEGTASPEVWGVALGCQALLGAPLSAAQTPALLASWQLPHVDLPGSALALRLDSLGSTLGQEPLAFALAKLGDAVHVPQPWRCQHRDLRLHFPQPQVRPVLEPLLADMLTITNAGALSGSQLEPDDDNEDAALPPAPILIEFGHSRSDVFAYALRQAQKQAGFQQLLDEDRHIIYRAPFRRSEMQRFWQLWNSVQSWSSAHVYREGRELEKWQIYPHSQYLR